jgi:hypothetical protein
LSPSKTFPSPLAWVTSRKFDHNAVRDKHSMFYLPAKFNYNHFNFLNMRKIYFLVMALCTSVVGVAQTVLYSNNFENGAGTATIVGNGQIVAETTAGFGSVFHNAAGGQATRTNYLQLPATIFADLKTNGSKELTIAFWVNVGTAANYYWTPIFSAYADAPAPAVAPATGTTNGMPMMVIQSRMVGQVNCNGWTDLVAADNVATVNTESTAWLDDAAWHYFTAVFTETSVKFLVDNVVKNAWTLNGTDGHTVTGLLTNGEALDYICLGGNQAWSWNDPDPAYKYDDVTIYASALTPNQIAANMASKIPTAVEKTTNDVSGDVVAVEYYSINGTKVANDYSELTSGIYIKKSIYENGAVVSAKIVKKQ